MSAAEPVRTEREDGLAVVSFDAPPLNLFDAGMQAGLLAALDSLETDPPRAVLFRPTAAWSVVGSMWRCSPRWTDRRRPARCSMP